MINRQTQRKVHKSITSGHHTGCWWIICLLRWSINGSVLSILLFFWYLLNVFPIIHDGSLVSQTPRMRVRQIIHELDEDSPFPTQRVFQQTLKPPRDRLLKAEGCRLSLWRTMTITKWLQLKRGSTRLYLCSWVLEESKFSTSAGVLMLHAIP